MEDQKRARIVRIVTAFIGLFRMIAELVRERRRKRKEAKEAKALLKKDNATKTAV